MFLEYKMASKWFSAPFVVHKSLFLGLKSHLISESALLTNTGYSIATMLTCFADVMNMCATMFY